MFVILKVIGNGRNGSICPTASTISRGQKTIRPTMVQIAKNPANNLLGSGIHALFSLATVVSGALFLLATAAGGALFLLATSVCCAFFFFGLRPRDFGIHITDPVRGRCSNLPNPHELVPLRQHLTAPI